MKARERINTRKIAVVAEFGFDPSDVPEDGFDESGFTVLSGTLHKLRGPNAEIQHQHEANSLPVSKILWPTEEWRARGMVARDDDFAEEVGPEAIEAIHRLESDTPSTCS